MVAALVWAAVRGRRGHVLFAWGTLFFLLMLLPTSNLLVPIGSIMAERFLYLPSVGFCLVAALALQPMGGALARLAVNNSRWQPWAARALPRLRWGPCPAACLPVAWGHRHPPAKITKKARPKPRPRRRARRLPKPRSSRAMPIRAGAGPR